MRISKVVLRNFKRFEEETFRLEGNVILTGPNNSGKTTLLQAIASWSLALGRWHELGDLQRRNGGYTRKNITRAQFYPVPLRSFHSLWRDKKRKKYRIEIDVTTDIGNIPMEFQSDTDLHMYFRPMKGADREVLRQSRHFRPLAFVPPVTGLDIDEPVYQQPKIDQQLGRGQPGRVLRNLLAEASADGDAWAQLTTAVESLFGYELLRPDASGADIVADYRRGPDGTRFDIGNAGSGFLQILMLLAFLCTRKETVLLLDTPDAHLHMILQDAIFGTLKAIARERNMQLLLATHSRLVINSAEPEELYSLAGQPRKLADDNEASSLIKSLSIPNADIMLAREMGCILYTESHTDLSILLAWATVLNHRLKDFLERPLWRPVVYEPRANAPGVAAEDHFGALLLVQDDLRGAAILDRDGRANRPASKLEHDGRLLKLCWTRYEIESYLIHPDALARFVGTISGEDAPLASVDAMKQTMQTHLPGESIDNPMLDNAILASVKARTIILQRILNDAELQGLPYSRYSEIAALMRPEEIHPEITRVLDTVADHLRL